MSPFLSQCRVYFHQVQRYARWCLGRGAGRERVVPPRPPEFELPDLRPPEFELPDLRQYRLEMEYARLEMEYAWARVLYDAYCYLVALNQPPEGQEHLRPASESPVPPAD